VHPALLLLETLRLRGGPEPAQLRAAWATGAMRGLARLAAFEGCALWLYRRLKQSNVAPAVAPAFAAWLERYARAAAAQNMRVDAQTEAILRLLNAEGIPHVLLKGAARRAAAHLFPYADARTTKDVDVLVPAAQAQPAWDQLRALSYDYAMRPQDTPAGHYHLPPLCDRARVAVELHTSTSGAVSPDEAWRRASSTAAEVRHNGITLRVPSPTELLWHAITHAGQHQAAFRLRFFQDAAVILASGAELDWQEIQARLDSPEIADRRATAGWLGAAAWLGGARLPEGIVRGAVPFDLFRAVRWRLAVLRRLRLKARIGEELLEEGTRELGWGLTAAIAGKSVALWGLRRAAAAAGRGTDSLWRAVRR
jgi:hypothetical protein